MSVDYFLKIDGIPGESPDAKHGAEIELRSWSWGECQPGIGARSTGGQGAGRVNMRPFVFTSETNKSSVKLLLSCAQGAHIDVVTLTCRKAGGEQQEFLMITLNDVIVSDYNVCSTHNEDGVSIPIDEVSLVYGKIQVEYRPQKYDGSLDNPIKGGYNLEANTSI
ncbi:Hcp family type VI secretion system effector [Lignipirellula cremea]|uniref:Major exported protein n=1 Tax=Lignipirellula cremea TaxID=2528010 RepID=A0A518DT33_9BACT|nr:type VI secretion system tube protein Hcp [Lignipirellula cremea]QDU95006.1 hypothetical protein Pla8534_28160 [Lignipirellula cremea]